MAESMYNIFGDHIIRQTLKNVGRQPLSNNENIGKIKTGPAKLNEPIKKGEAKKSFLANKGKALQSTPVRQVFTPRAVNVGPLIYSDPDANLPEFNMEEIEFTRPTYRYDTLQVYEDFEEYPAPQICKQISPPVTPPPALRHSMSLEFDDSSYHDDFFNDDFSNACIQDDDLGLPEIY